MNALTVNIIGTVGLLLAASATAVMASPVERRPVAEVVTPITGDATDLELYPKPRQESYSGQALRLPPVSIEAAGLDATPALRLLNELLNTWGLEQPATAPGHITLRLVDAPTAWQPAPDQGYRLSVEPRGDGVAITIEGGGPAGLFYGLQTLRQLVHTQDDRLYIREAVIEDWPAVPFRGPASVADARWKMNLSLFPFQWPPSDPNATQRAENRREQASIRSRLQAIDRELAAPQQGVAGDLDALLDDILDSAPGADDRNPMLTDHLQRDRRQLSERLEALQAGIAVYDDAYAAHKVEAEAALRARIQRYREHHIEPVMYYRDPRRTWGQPADPEEGTAFIAYTVHVNQLLHDVQQAYKVGYESGIRHFALEFGRTTFHAPGGDPAPPGYGQVQADVTRRIMAWLRELDPKNQFYLRHQKDAVRNRPIHTHVWKIGHDFDVLAADFAAADPPAELHIMWSGCGESVPRVTADHARFMTDLYGGRPASFLDLEHLRFLTLHGRLISESRGGGQVGFGIGHFIGNGVMERHDPALAEQLTFVNIPGWGNRQWGWNAEGYEVPRVTAVMLREGLRGIGGPAAYRELAELARYQREHGHFAIIRLGWFLHAMLGEDQNRLAPEQVETRMADKRSFYAARLTALRAALPPAGDTLYATIETEVEDRLQYLDIVAATLKARPVATGIRAAGPVILDGRLDEEAWARAPAHGGFKGFGRREGETAWLDVSIETTFRVVYDDDYVYIAVHCEEPDVDRIHAQAGDDLRAIMRGDYVQLVIDPTGLKQRATHLTTTIHGQNIAGHDGCWMAGTDPGPLLDWQWPRTFTVKTARIDDGWTAEFAIALADLDPQYRPTPGQRWGFNVIRRQLSRIWTSSHHHWYNHRDYGGKPNSGIFENRFGWHQMSLTPQFRPVFRGQILYCGALAFD